MPERLLMAWGAVLAVELALLYTGGSRLSGRLLGWTLGSRGPKRFLGWMLMVPGTALHETSHAIIALLLGGRIHKFVPFRPVQNEDGGVQLGYVEHTAVFGGPVGGAMVGMAPLIGVPLSVWGLGLLMLPVGGSPDELLHWALAHPLSLGPLWLAIGALLSLGALPSPSDHRDLPLAGLLLLALLGGLSFLGVSIGTGGLVAPLSGWAQLLFLPALVSLAGWLPRRR